MKMLNLYELKQIIGRFYKFIDTYNFVYIVIIFCCSGIEIDSFTEVLFIIT